MEIKNTKTAYMPNKQKIILFALALALSISIAFAAGALMHRSRSLTRIYRFAKGFLRHPVSIPANYVRAQLVRPERIYIDIGYKNFQKLIYWRKLALETGTLYAVEQNYLNAQIRYKDGILPVRIRLKGGIASQHLLGEKWSLRIEVQGHKTLFGMKSFSLMDPERRNFMLEWLTRRIMGEEGIIAKRYKFVEVVINGENKGIYAMDEHYGRIMLEANQRREGPVIRLAQEPFWFEEAAWNISPSESDEYYFSMDIDALDSGKIVQDPIQFEQFKKAANLYNAFRNGQLETSQVFDIDKFSKWMAIGDIMGAWHGFGANNMRFYYNPVTSKLEPIPDDCFNETTTDPGNRVFRLNDQYNKGKFLKQVFSDLKFTEKYIESLERVSKASYLDNMLDVLGKEIEENLDILNKYYYPIYEFPKEQLYKNQEDLREILNPYKGITAYFEEKRPESIVLSIACVKTIPIEISNVVYKEHTVLYPRDSRVILKGKDYAVPLIFNKVEFNLPEKMNNADMSSELKVNYRLLGTSRLRTEPVFPWPDYNPDFFTGDFIIQKANFQDFDFIKVEEPSKEICIKQGRWILDKSLIIPEGHVFSIEPGTRLDLINSASILSYSPIKLVGLDDEPLIIGSSDSSGGGIVVLNAGRESLLENVIFENLAAPSKDAWHLTGAITFYESPTYINKCRFLNNRSEDAVNIIRSNVTIDNSYFQDNASDALDFDFCRGRISNTSFYKSGNDSLDFAGSAVVISKIFINGTGDKGISIGENSQADLKDIEIKNANVALAVKDLSEIYAEDMNICNSRIGFALYQKKPEFGPASITARSIKFTDVPEMYLVEEKSSFILDDRKIKGAQQDIAKRLY